jgi:hypothetical protein
MAAKASSGKAGLPADADERREQLNMKTDAREGGRQ